MTPQPFAPLRDRPRLIRWCIVALILGISPAAPASAVDPPAAGRTFIIRGVTDPDPDLLARSLAANDDILLLTSPFTTRKAFLAAVADKARLAMQHQGYADAQAAATVETHADGTRVIIDVVPGPRYSAAGIEINGLPDDLSQELRSWLKSQRPPADAIPRTVDTDGGWSGTQWVDTRGQPAAMQPALWQRGQPAPFDAYHLHATRRAIARFLRDHAYFAAAKLLEKPDAAGRSGTTGASCDVRIRPDADGAVLAISFTELPPASILRDIEVAPASRTTATILCEKLGIELGKPATDHNRLAWREWLRQSGRFVRHEVKFRETKPGDDGLSGMVAIFDLSAYSHVPPLAEPLSREEEVMLRCRSWLLATLANEDDLVITWTPGPAARSADHPEVGGGLVISTREGLLLTGLPGTADACGVAVSSAGLGWYLPHAAGWFEVPLPGRLRAAVNVAFTLSEKVAAGHHTYPREISTSCAIESRPRDTVAAAAITAQIEPVACLSIVHDDRVDLRWEDDILVVRAGPTESRFEGATGRLVSVGLPDGGRLSLEAAPHRFATDLATLREAAGDDAARDDALVSSGVLFFTGDEAAHAVDRLLAAAGMPEPLAAWRPRLAAVAEKLQRAVERGGFAVADRHVADALRRATEDEATPLVTIPGSDPGEVHADPLMALGGVAATRAWRWLDRACGRDAWPTALARLATLAAKKDSTAALWEVTAFMAAKQHGPLAYLAAANVVPVPTMAVSFARQGQERLTAEGFHADSAAVLAILNECGLDHGIVSVLRSLDDDEVRSVGEEWLHDPAALVPLVNDLRSQASEDAAVAVLPAALDRWWETSLRVTVAAALAARTEIQTADKPAAEPAARR